MNDAPAGLCGKIARLVEERGWNQEEFARRANLNRLTVRNLFAGVERRLHNATVGACAQALGLTVAELKTESLALLLSRMKDPGVGKKDAPALDQLLARGQSELAAWIERNPDRAARLSGEEREELLTFQGTGGSLSAFGVAHVVELIERKRRLRQKVAAVAGTEYLDLLEQFVEVLFEKIQPYRDRAEANPKG